MIVDRTRARNLIRTAIRDEFRRLNKIGGLQALARKIGIKDYQNLQNYAKGTIPQADTFLLACVYLGMTVRIDYEEEEGSRIGQVTHLEFAARQNAASTRSASDHQQLNLFEAIEQLDQNSVQITIARKLADRVELSVGIDFQRTAS